MAIISVSGSESPESIQTPLLLGVVQGSVDYKGLPIYRSNSGGWRSASFILGMELAERLAYYGIASNLITYLTGPLGQSTATAAENVNAWTGASFLFPLIGAFVADSFLGRLLEQTNLMKKTLGNTMPKARSSTGVMFIISHPPSRHGTLVFNASKPNKSTKTEIYVLIANGNKDPDMSFSCPSRIANLVFLYARFLDKALFVPNDSNEREKVCSLSEVEEAKAILGLVPIWASCLLFGVLDVQFPTLCTKQGATMDRSIAPGFNIPPASFQSIVTLSVVTFIPIYDRIIVPLARDLTREPSGITMLQRIGTGMFFSALSMAIAAIVEMKRLAVACEYGLVDKPNETLPMSIWWLVPQYITDGVAHALTAVGMQEFFYDQVPRELRSVGLSLFISAIGVGSLISSFLISIIEIVTGGKGRDSWFANNLNRAHLDYFYWLLAGLGTLQLVAYLYFAKKYVNKR
ncbi:hypothetical protein GH714_021563 [Hevea brasiliensis]|uniref:Uncharacterized protein n=1 Tax=Hevea brasiliensis TaxID=3981 RepID=A0A6A6LAL0_HEVBR|nr:hypothetical protein GH714_021563 [Hevea brasiliensis]